MVNIFGKENISLNKREAESLNKKIDKSPDYTVQHVLVPTKKVCYFPEIKTPTGERDNIDSLKNNFSPLFFTPIIVVYWRSEKKLCLGDGYRHLKLFSDSSFTNNDPYFSKIRANVIDIEAEQQRIVTEEEVISRCADIFLEANAIQNKARKKS